MIFLLFCSADGQATDKINRHAVDIFMDMQAFGCLEVLIKEDCPYPEEFNQQSPQNVAIDKFMEEITSFHNRVHNS